MRITLETRDHKYHHGHSTPRPFRCNDRLWQDFAEVTKRCYGKTPTEAMRDLMEQVVLAHGVVDRRRVSARRIERQRSQEYPDIVIIE